MLSESRSDGFFCALSVPKIDAVDNDVITDDDQQRHDQMLRDQEEISLWSHYGDGLRGIRITYDPLRLKGMGVISSALVKYQDSPDPIDATLEVRKRKAYFKDRWNYKESLMLFNNKAKLWSNEREVRIRTFRQGKVEIPPYSIKAVTFGAKMPIYRRILIIAATRHHNPDAVFYEARISNREYKIEYTQYEVPPLVNAWARPANLDE
jgi:hypothetical protein